MGSTKEGLDKLRKKYNTKNGWKYGGGARKTEYIHGLNYYQIVETRHSRYYENQLRPQWIKEGLNIAHDYVPKHKDKCICDHFISENCFIYKKENGNFHIRVIGNCCIKKFDLQGRKCQMCDAVHKNRKDNYCNDCRIIVAKEKQKKKWKMQNTWNLDW
jgi:hypothetical protein